MYKKLSAIFALAILISWAHAAKPPARIEEAFMRPSGKVKPTVPKTDENCNTVGCHDGYAKHLSIHEPVKEWGGEGCHEPAAGLDDRRAW